MSGCSGRSTTCIVSYRTGQLPVPRQQCPQILASAWHIDRKIGSSSTPCSIACRFASGKYAQQSAPPKCSPKVLPSIKADQLFDTDRVSCLISALVDGHVPQRFASGTNQGQASLGISRTQQRRQEMKPSTPYMIHHALRYMGCSMQRPQQQAQHQKHTLPWGMQDAGCMHR